MAKTNAPTMKDVAKEAGVSLGTVSKVINGITVREEYKKKVEAAIASLHYEINTYARGLKTKKTGLVAVIIPNMLNPEKEIAYLNLATQNKVDGIVALTYSDIGNFINPDIPIVVFDRFFENRNIPRVGSDNYNGSMMAIEKLLELGCRHPVYIRFHSIFPGESDKRKDGYLAACKKFHITPDFLDMEDCDNFIDMMKQFIDKHKKSDGSLSFDGVFCHTDYHGYLFKKLLQKEGYRVPEDVQLIGFDGIRKFGGLKEDLFVSSMCQPLPQLAAKCVEIITTEDRSMIPSLTLLPVTFEDGGTTRSLKKG